MFGAAIAFYVLMLRPVVYEMLWFASLFEYTALLVLLLATLLNVINKLRIVANTPGTVEPVLDGLVSSSTGPRKQGGPAG